MRILSINFVYDEGSTGRIVKDIHCRLERDGHESYVVYGLGKKHDRRGGRLYKTTSDFMALQYSRVSKILGLRYNCAYVETFFLLRHIRKVNPDIVHVHCLNESYVNPFILLQWLGKHDYKVLVTHHADVLITANCDHSYDCELWKTGCDNSCTLLRDTRICLIFSNARKSWKQMKNAFGYIRQLYAAGVSGWMADRVKKSPFFSNRVCRVIENGLDVSSFMYDADNANTTISGLKARGIKVVLHVTPSLGMQLKGGHYVMALAKKMPDVRFVIVGHKDEPIADIPDNVIMVPYIGSKRELASYYQGADVTLLTSRRESFSQVTAESLCCGTPVVGFRAGAPETIALPNYSAFVEYGDIDMLQQQLGIFFEKNFDKAEISSEACRRYDAEVMYKNYLTYYQDIMNGCSE